MDVHDELAYVSAVRLPGFQYTLHGFKGAGKRLHTCNARRVAQHRGNQNSTGGGYDDLTAVSDDGQSQPVKTYADGRFQ